METDVIERTHKNEKITRREASFDAKLRWYESFNESAYEDFWSSPEPPEFLPAVLLDACDESGELQLIMKRSHAKKLNEIGAEENAIFLASAERARGEPLRQRCANNDRESAGAGAGASRYPSGGRTFCAALAGRLGRRRGRLGRRAASRLARRMVRRGLRRLERLS